MASRLLANEQRPTEGRTALDAAIMKFPELSLEMRMGGRQSSLFDEKLEALKEVLVANCEVPPEGVYDEIHWILLKADAYMYDNAAKKWVLPKR